MKAIRRLSLTSVSARKCSIEKVLFRRTYSLQWILLLLISAIISSTWAATAPMPVVTGDQLSWPVVSAKTINVHTGDGSYVESIARQCNLMDCPGAR